MSDSDKKISVCITCKMYVLVDGESEQIFIKKHKDERGHPVMQMPASFLKKRWKLVCPSDEPEVERYRGSYNSHHFRKPITEEEVQQLMDG